MKRETYKAACEQARAELRDIMNEFENLRMRKEQIERMIEVLEPLSGPEGGLSARVDRERERRFDISPVAEMHEVLSPRSEERAVELAPVPVAVAVAAAESAESHWESAPVAVEEAPVAAMEEGEAEPVFQPEEVSSDPIKRRIANALRHRAVLRDNREFNQAFSGGITRW